MNDARDTLVTALQEERPLVLLLGQGAWADPGHADELLERALRRIGHTNDDPRGWTSLLGVAPLPESFYEWLSERFERRAHPLWLSSIGALPWSAVFTSSIDPTVSKLLQENGREPEILLTAGETPRAGRSRARPPLYYLFGLAGAHDRKARPPANRLELNSRRIVQAMPMLNRALDTATSLGHVVVEGFDASGDWLSVRDLLGALGHAASGQILWFGGRPSLSSEDAEQFDAAVHSGQVLLESARLGAVIAELQSLDRLPETAPPESEEAGVISLLSDKRFETRPEDRLRVEAVASIVDDSWTSFLSPLGPDAEYAAFRQFHGDMGGRRLLVEGIRRKFAIERDFEEELQRHVDMALVDHSSINLPIMVHGQSGTGKSIALARVVATVRERKTAPVLYATSRIPQPIEVADFCEAAEKAGAKSTLLVCDANLNLDPYRELLMGLRSRGRRVVVVGSQYRGEADGYNDSPISVESPTKLSAGERSSLGSLLSRFTDGEGEPDTTSDTHILAFLYRFLPPSRPRIAAGLGAEARAAEQSLRERGAKKRKIFPETELAQKLIDAGFADSYQPVFDEEQYDVLEAADAAGRLIDLVMVTGSLNCPIPVNLLLRAVTNTFPAVDIPLINDMFGKLDLFRWKWADAERSELLVLPRLTLEAELICRRRLGGRHQEAERLIEIIAAARGSDLDREHERRFLLNLLRQVGANGPRGARYRDAYVKIGRTLTDLRNRFGVLNASLMLQESAFRRAAVREEVVEEAERLPLLEEARDAVQAALDMVADGTLRVAQRTLQSLQGERASLYGFLASDRARRNASPSEIWSSYEAARAAIRRAVGISDDYVPLDVGLWTPADLLRIASLTEVQQAELAADIYARLDQVDPETLPPKQQERFHSRRLQLGQVLKDQKLADEAYAELERGGSTAGYFLRARGMGPELQRETIDVAAAEDIERAREAADFLQSRFAAIEGDERCLSLLLEYRWIAATGRRPLRGERQPLPYDEAARRTLLSIVRALNEASGEASRHVTRYLEAVLTWVLGDEPAALEMFRALGRETEFEDPSRVFRRHVIADEERRLQRFDGRIESGRSEGHWRIRVDGINRLVDLLSRDFPREDVAYGRTIKGFAIAFNFIGPIADPIRSRQ